MDPHPGHHLGPPSPRPPGGPSPPNSSLPWSSIWGRKSESWSCTTEGRRRRRRRRRRRKRKRRRSLQAANREEGGVADALAADWLRLSQARRRQGELRRALGRVKENYLEVLSSSLSLLVDLLGVAEENAGLDEGHAHYLEVKAEAVLAKIRLEEIELLLATYPPPTLEAHRRIRSALEERRGQIRGEAELLRASLSAYQELGPSFTELAQQYQSLRQRLQERRWALSQLRPAPP
ncbi:HAUS augmin-like complex subunit 4 [Melanerpes formicivorus]|uniref:HAUS augmin-like complex subunit 4 n=1 Tax=Melanerpes formicivorus TaxID=211600 RepID=UPI00358E6932